MHGGGEDEGGGWHGGAPWTPLEHARRRGRKKKEARGITVYTKIPYAVVILQLSPKLYHT
jgi:hypothetical protein